MIDTLSESEKRTPLLILNGPVNTNFNQEIVGLAKYFKLPCIVDDASESKVQPLTWYIQQLHNVPAVLSQLSATSRSGFELHNAKCALISGF